MPAPDPYRAEHVRSAIVERTKELDVHVDMVAGALVVTGSVQTEQRRAAVTAVANEVGEGLPVRDELTVVPNPEPGDEEVVR